MNYKFSKTKKAFSMIELLIVVAIMIVMTGAVFLNRNNSKAGSEVEAAGRKVASQIHALQNEALNGKQFDTNGDGIGDTNALSYKFDIVNNATTYSVSYYSDTAATTQIGSSQTFNLSNKGSVKAGASGGASFYFKSPNGSVDSAKTIILKSAIANVCGSVSVSASGVVNEVKNFTPCT